MSTITKAPQRANVREEMIDVIIDSMRDIKANNIVKLDLQQLHDAPTDIFIICDGDSSTQVKSIAERVSYRVKTELGEYAKNAEGSRESRWICLDYFDVVVHVFHKEARAFYELEDLWSDAELTEYESL